MNINVKVTSAKGVFVNNKWQVSRSGRTIPIVAPADGQAFAEIAAGNDQDIDLAVKAARRAVEQGAWGRMTATERGRLLSRLANLIESHSEELAKLEATDTGKPMKQAKADVVAVARYFEYYGAAADKVHGDTIPFLDGYFVTTVYEPLGVTGHIIPWKCSRERLCPRWRWVTPRLSNLPRKRVSSPCGSLNLPSRWAFRKAH